MNPHVYRYLPPVLVLVAALFFGWPPSKPLDLGDDFVKASSVRWRPNDLADPPRVTSSRDPFEEPVAAVEEVEISDADIALARPLGPDAETLKAGLQFDGLANVGGRTWAVLNGRPRLAGDFVTTNDANRYKCQIVSVQSDHIVVRCQETVAELRPRDTKTVGRPASRRSPAAPGNRAPRTRPDDNQSRGAAAAARDANTRQSETTRS
jgi:hypothetical protein